MINRYFLDLRSLWTNPADFFGRSQSSMNEKDAFRFANLTGVLVALELGLLEILSGGSWLNVVLMTAVMFLALPFLVNVWIYLWDGFLRLCASLLGKNLSAASTRLVVAYSLAGLVALGIGFGLGKWLVLATLVFQIVGLEKSLRCSRWTAGVYVLFPFSLVAVLLLFTVFIFKVFK